MMFIWHPSIHHRDDMSLWRTCTTFFYSASQTTLSLSRLRFNQIDNWTHHRDFIQLAHHRSGSITFFRFLFAFRFFSSSRSAPSIDTNKTLVSDRFHLRQPPTPLMKMSSFCVSWWSWLRIISQLRNANYDVKVDIETLFSSSFFRPSFTPHTLATARGLV